MLVYTPSDLLALFFFALLAAGALVTFLVSRLRSAWRSITRRR